MITWHLKFLLLMLPSVTDVPFVVMLWESIWVFAEASSPKSHKCGWEKGLCLSGKGGCVTLVLLSGGGCRGSLCLWWIVALGTGTRMASCSVRGVWVTIMSWAALPEIAFQQHWGNVPSAVNSSSAACQTLGNAGLIREPDQGFVWQIHLNSEHWCNMNSQIHGFWLVKTFLSSICWWTPAARAGITLCGEGHVSLIFIDQGTSWVANTET